MQNQVSDKPLDEILGKKDFLKQLLLKSGGIVKASMPIPGKDEVVMAKKSEKNKQKLNEVNKRYLNLIQRMSKLVDDNAQININKFGSIIDINDQLLENIDTSLDKIKHQNSKDKKLVFEQKQVDHNSNLQAQKKDRIQDIYFPDCIDNSSLPFVPKLKTKYNSVSPLEDTIVSAQQERINFFKDIQEPENYNFPHPYQTEINQIEYMHNQTSADTIHIQEVELITPENFLYVDSSETLQILLGELKQAKEIGIDLEHHNYRTFQGITCLIQISTKQKDYVIDPFPIWKELHILNEVFTDPKIVKILHGADMDILWLQRDFGLYIVNMFDTGQAARQLKLPSYSLAYLLKTYCAIEADKKYQLADWRQRPLSKEMMYYARCDTHYLFKIYDSLKNDLIKVAIVKQNDPYQQQLSVLKKSAEVCLQKYEKPILKDNSYLSIIQRHKAQYNKNKMTILEKLMEWRYEKARAADESLRYILANDVLFQIVYQLPPTVNDLFMKFRNLSPTVKENAQEIIDIICNAYGEQSKDQKVKQNQKKINSQILQIQKIEIQEDEDLNEDFEKMTIQKYDIVIKSYQKIKQTDNHNNNSGDMLNFNDGEETKNEVLENVKNSFSYSEPLELYCEVYPQLQGIYSAIKEREQEQVNQLVAGNQEEENKQTEGQQVEEPTQVDFIELPKVQEVQKPKDEELRFPSALGDQYDINLKRKRQKKYKFEHGQQATKKVQNDNAFSAFGNNNNEDDQEEARMEEEEEKQNQQQQQKQQNQNQEDEDDEDEELNEKRFNKEIEMSMQMNEIADKVKQNMVQRNQFSKMMDPIDSLYRNSMGGGRKKKKGGQGQRGGGANRGGGRGGRFVKKH